MGLIGLTDLLKRVNSVIVDLSLFTVLKGSPRLGLATIRGVKGIATKIKKTISMGTKQSNGCLLAVLGLWKHKRAVTVVVDRIQDILFHPMVLIPLFASYCYLIYPLWVCIDGLLNKAVVFTVCLSPIIYLWAKWVRHKAKVSQNQSEAWEISTERWEQSLRDYAEMFGKKQN